MPAYTVPARVESPFVARPVRRERGWFETGFLIMTLPVAIGVGLMVAPIIAPIAWMFGSRSRQ